MQYSAFKNISQLLRALPFGCANCSALPSINGAAAAAAAYVDVANSF
jgi:hypothetical protein